MAKNTSSLHTTIYGKLCKACFQHDMVYGDFKDLAKGTASDKVLCHKAFNIAKNPKYEEYQRDLASMFYRFFHKKSQVVVLKISQIKN